MSKESWIALGGTIASIVVSLLIVAVGYGSMKKTVEDLEKNSVSKETYKQALLRINNLEDENEILKEHGEQISKIANNGDKLVNYLDWLVKYLCPDDCPEFNN